MKMNKRLMRLSGVMLSASFLVSCLGVPALAADSLAKMEKNETVYIYHRCGRYSRFRHRVRLAEKRR